jgi:hypothetical protein
VAGLQGHGRGLHALGKKRLRLRRQHQIVGRDRVIGRLEAPRRNSRLGAEGGAADWLLLLGQLRAFGRRHVADEDVREGRRVDGQKSLSIRMNGLQALRRRAVGGQGLDTLALIGRKGRDVNQGLDLGAVPDLADNDAAPGVADQGGRTILDL